MNRIKQDKNLKESAVHRSGRLPLKIYSDDYVRYHWHDEYEFIFSEGGFVHCTVNGMHVLLEPGTALLIQPGDLHAVSVDQPQRVTEIVANSSFWATEEDNELFSGKLRFQMQFVANDPTDAAIVERLREIKRCYTEQGFGYEFRLKSLFSDIFSSMLANGRYHVEKQESVKESDTSKNLFSYVHQHYADDLSLEHLASLSHYSKSYVIKLFKKNTGQTPIEYINRYRLDQAKSFLQNPKNSILDVSLMSGFQNVGYFIRIFKAHFGMTPGVYRKEILKGVR